jgi:signal peptidase
MRRGRRFATLLLLGGADQPTAADLPRPRWRSALAAARLLVMLTFLVMWVLLLRPQALGGPATWVLVSGNSMQPRLHDGDLVLALRRSHYRRGDVIAYRIPRGDVGAGTMIIHRIAGGNGRTGFATRGDNRTVADLWRPTDAEIAGRLIASVPAVGDGLQLLRTPLVLAAFAALAAFLSVPGRRRAR